VVAQPDTIFHRRHPDIIQFLRGILEAKVSWAVRDKTTQTWKKDLQLCAEGSNSRKMPALVVGKNPNGKYPFRQNET
jgi:hypothetical protein